MSAACAFSPCRDLTISAIYRLREPLPVAVHWPSFSQRLHIAENDYPPHVALEFDCEMRCPEFGCLYELESIEHGMTIAREGLRVAVPSLLNTFCERLVADGRASMIAGPHCEIPWAWHIELALNRAHPETCLDAFWGNWPSTQLNNRKIPEAAPPETQG